MREKRRESRRFKGNELVSWESRVEKPFSTGQQQQTT